MPHHSGGGSHSGGFHGGGFHGGGFHSSSSSSLGSNYRQSHFYFSGARRYRYYDRSGESHYLYANQKPYGLGAEGLFAVILVSILVCVGICLSVSNNLKMLWGPQKLDASYQIPTTYVHDHMDWIDNEEELNETLDEFRELTGICPYILTVDKAGQTQWEIEDYAYQFYIENFDDEEHFLIVISEDYIMNNIHLDIDMGGYTYTYDGDSQMKLAWEAIQGDRTDYIITEEHFEQFGRDLQWRMDSKDSSLGESLNKTFQESLSYMMCKQPNIEIDVTMPITTCAIIGGAVIIILIASFWSYCMGRRKYELDTDSTEED